jgi:RNA-directed DNA polymerase
VTQDNQGKKTAGVDGVKSLSSVQRIALVRKLELKGKSKPTRRVWIDKPGEESVLEVDHVIPKSKGGKNSYENLQLLHRHCHDEKTASDIAEARAKEMEVSQKMERVKQIAESFARGESKGLRLNEVPPGNKSGCNSAKPKPVIKAKSLGNRGINDNDLITEEPDEVKTSRPVLKTSGTRESLA